MFLKILEEKKLNIADKYLQKIINKYIVFKQIFRNESNDSEKVFDLTSSGITILDENQNILKAFDENYLKNKPAKIFEKIKNTPWTTFEIPEASSIMKDLLCSHIKASNTTKSDISGIIYDRFSESNKEKFLGFSIKSMIGGASTLLNAGKTTNFIYKISGLNHSLIQEINKINTKSKIQDRINAIKKYWGSLEFYDVSKKEFKINLKKIDTIFHIFLAQMLLEFFSWRANKVSELVKLLAQNNELKRQYDLNLSDYEFKVKNFLISIALWMMPSKVWDGFTEANGGYIIVKKDWEIVCYHLYNRDDFLTYLFENTKFESSSSKRHDYGLLYEKDWEIYFNLNLQIRFLK